MKKLGKVLLAGGVACAATLWVGAESAFAIPQFKKQFDAMYVDEDSDDPAKQALAEAAKEAKCDICHMGRNKKMRNPYGEQLSELLDKKEDKNNKEKIDEALETVAEIKVDPDDENSPTYGQLLDEGKLPVVVEE